MERLGWISFLGDPTTMVAMLAAGVIPLLLFPAPAGQVVAVMAVVAVMLINHHIDSSTRRLPVRIGTEALRGRVVTVLEDLSPAGLVRCDGETWRAIEMQGRRVEAGEKVTIVGVSGLDLEVVRGDSKSA